MKLHLSIRNIASSFAIILFASGLALPTQADTLFENVRIFDGRSDRLSEPSHVLVRGNVIEEISPTAIEAEGVEVIDGAGRTLMPGLIDAHWHTMLVGATSPVGAMADGVGYLNLVASAQAEATLMRGFTTVRDLGGPSFGLKRAIDEGLVVGPRIYPSGAMITITSGHGDFRNVTDLPRTIGGYVHMSELMGAAAIADSPDEVRVRAREQLMQGASQIKLTAGGGVSSPFSPIDVSTFTEEELRAAVEAAENWGTYVGAHAYTTIAIRRAIAAGVKVIEHGHLMDDATAQLMAENEIWLSTQPFLDDSAAAFLDENGRDKLFQVLTGTDRVYELAKKHGLKVAFGTDILFARRQAAEQGSMLVSLTRWYTPAEALSMATASNGELLLLSGLRNPYPGTIGVVEEGALADLIVVDGDPLDNIDIIAEPEERFVVIMKDGTIYKNTLSE